MNAPCRVVQFTHAVKWLYIEMLYEEFARGCLRADIDRDGFLYMIALLNYFNRRDGKVFVVRATIADDLGLPSRGHGLKKAKEAFVRHGFLVELGKQGRSDVLAVTLPESLREKYPDLADATEGEVLNVKPADPWAPGNQRPGWPDDPFAP